jgi:hypothetical protein
MSRRVSIALRQAATALALCFSIITIAAAQTPNPNPVGEWDLQSDAQGQITKFTLSITKDGDVYKGKASSEAYGSEELKDLKVEGAVVTYTRNLPIADQVVPMTFKGTIDGDKLTGAYSILGQELPVTGGRKGTAAAAK